MPAFEIRKSIEIDAPAAQVFDTIVDFSSWGHWSPWLCIEPDANVTVSSPANEIGSHFQWQGKLVGEGGMSHRHLEPGKSIQCDLTFIKPFKSNSDVRFDFEKTGGGTKVTWVMNGKLPFFLFWMKARMVAYVGMDYERGLLMLKDWIETGEIHSKVNFMGLEDRSQVRLLGSAGHCSMDQIESEMTTVFENVLAAFDRAGVDRDGEVISIYLPSSDMQNGQVDFISGMITNESVNGLSETILPAGTYLHARHVGSYKHLGNAWFSVYQNAMQQKRKVAKSASYEIYGNDPKDTPEQERITDLYLPVR